MPAMQQVRIHLRSSCHLSQLTSLVPAADSGQSRLLRGLAAKQSHDSVLLSPETDANLKLKRGLSLDERSELSLPSPRKGNPLSHFDVWRSLVLHSLLYALTCDRLGATTLMTTYNITPAVEKVQEFIEIANDFSIPLDLVREALSNSRDAGASTLHISFEVTKEYGDSVLVIRPQDSDSNGLAYHHR
jgi:hypothetical protein